MLQQFQFLDFRCARRCPRQKLTRNCALPPLSRAWAPHFEHHKTLLSLSAPLPSRIERRKRCSTMLSCKASLLSAILPSSFTSSTVLDRRFCQLEFQASLVVGPPFYPRRLLPNLSGSRLHASSHFLRLLVQSSGHPRTCVCQLSGHLGQTSPASDEKPRLSLQGRLLYYYLSCPGF